MTPKIIPSTSHAALVCEPKNRDARPSRSGELRHLITVNVMIPASTATANRSSRKPMASQCPIPGMANVRLNRSPYDSMIVSSKKVKPQNVRACATPGTVHFSSLRCPITSVVSVATSRAGMLAHGLDPLRGRLPAQRQPLQPPQPAPGDRERDRSQDQADGHPQDHANLLNIRSSSVAVQARRDMITSAQPRHVPSRARTHPGPVITLFPNGSGLTPPAS